MFSMNEVAFTLKVAEGESQGKPIFAHIYIDTEFGQNQMYGIAGACGLLPPGLTPKTELTFDIEDLENLVFAGYIGIDRSEGYQPKNILTRRFMAYDEWKAKQS